MKYLFREIEAESSEIQFYFDGDSFNANSGDYNNTLFIITFDRYRLDGYNFDEYKNVMEKAEEIIDGFSCVENDCVDYDGKGYTYKEIIEDAGYKYNSTMCHKLKEWYHGETDTRKTEVIADFLTIVTGQKWNTKSVYGYCQGDYAELVYCKKAYQKPEIHGEIYLGCCKEFSFCELDENGEEIETVCGYYVADCEVKTDEDYKNILCKMEGISPEETQVELIENSYTTRHYNYKVI